MTINNRIAACIDPRQGASKRVLCVCYGNQLRSPTAAFVLSNEPFNFNTRSCGLDSKSAVCLIDNVMVDWADEIVVMEDKHAFMIREIYNPQKPIKVLGFADNYNYRDSEFMKLIIQRYKEL